MILLQSRSIASLALLAIVSATTMSAGEKECKTLAQSRLTVERELEPKLGHVHLHRVQELEDALAVSQASNKKVFMYQVQEQTGTSYKYGDQAILVTGSGGDYQIYAAISSDGKRIYRLGGVPDRGTAVSEPNTRARDWLLWNPTEC